jgi:hypothetical protein
VKSLFWLGIPYPSLISTGCVTSSCVYNRCYAQVGGPLVGQGAEDDKSMMTWIMKYVYEDNENTYIILNDIAYYDIKVIN